jgi:hypothetical protein
VLEGNMLDVLLNLGFSVVLVVGGLLLHRAFRRQQRALLAAKAQKIPVAWQSDPTLNGALAWVEIGRRCPELFGIAADRVLGQPVVDHLVRKDQEDLARAKAGSASHPSDNPATERKHAAHKLPSPSKPTGKMSDERTEELYAQLRSILRELDPELTNEEIETALARTLLQAQREKKMKFPAGKAKK